MSNNRKKFIVALIPPLIIIPLAGVLFLSRAHAIDLISHPKSERKPIEQSPADFELPFEEVWITSQDGLDLVAWYIPSTNGALVMAQHGYKGNRSEMLEESVILYEHGYGVLITSVRAHDLSDGDRITFGYLEVGDLEAWYQFLVALPEVDPNRIGMLGNSMGASLVIQYAAQNERIKAVIAHSAFSSLDDTVVDSLKFFTGLPSFPFSDLIVFWAERELGGDSSLISAKTWIGDISPRAILLLHGGQDELISQASGETLFQAAGSPKELWFEPQLGHAEFDTAMPEEFEERVVGFFDRYLLGD